MDKLAILWVACLTAVVILNCQDMYRWHESDYAIIHQNRDNIGKIHSCMTDLGCTLNEFCPNGGYSLGTDKCRK